MEPLTTDQRDRYLDRIGLAGRPDADLAELQFAHLQHVPFENLSIHLGEPIELSTAALFDKIVDRRRGGFCYELNGLFGRLLTALGHDVVLLSASVHMQAGGLTPPFDHMVLRVGDSFLDVGFGRHSAHPVRIDTDADQPDPFGTFRVVVTEHGDVDVLCDGRPRYRTELRPREMPDFEPTCWWQQTWPGSHFRTGPVCSLQTADGGQRTLAGRKLITTARSGERIEMMLDSDADVLAAYRSYFGVTLDRVPARSS